MYNEDMKREFIKHYTDNAGTARMCENLFLNTERYEREWGADLCTQDAETLQPLVDSVSGLRAQSKWSRLIVLKEYVRWCKYVVGYRGARDDMLSINSTGLEKIKNQMVANPLQLQQYLDAIYTKEEEDTVDNTLRCYSWLAYGGLAADDILKVTTRDVDLYNMVIHFNNREFPIYREGLPCIKKCVELDHFNKTHPRYKKPQIIDRLPGDILIRGAQCAPTVEHFRTEMARAALHSDRTTMRLSYYKIWLSGLFYRTREKELVGIPPNFIDAVNGRLRGKLYKLDKSRNSQESKVKYNAWQYEVDYQRWKLAFYI